MGPEGCFPINPDLANILGRTNFDFENLYFGDFFGFHIPGFPDFQTGGVSGGSGWERQLTGWSLQVLLTTYLIPACVGI